MDVLYEFSLETIRWLQANYPQLAGFFLFVTFMGEEQFYLAVLPLIYWCIDKKLGRQLGYLFFVSLCVNVLFKQLIREPRPFWLDGEMQLGETAGYGFPSNHVQSATVLALFIAAWVRRGWVWIVALLFVVVMALSRVYLGLHFVHDTVGGFLIGLLLLLGFFLWRRYLAERLQRRILGQRMMVVILLPGFLALLYVGVRLLVGPANLDLPWAEAIPFAEINAITEMTTAVSSLFGFGIGIILEGSRVRFRSDGPLGQRVLRYLVGIAVTVALWLGLGAIFPRDPLWLAVPLRIIRYGIVTLWAAYYAPMLFVRFGLAAADPEPEISLKL